MSHYQTQRPSEDSEFVRDVRRLGRNAWAYVTTRSLEHWLLFAAGIIVGLLVD